MIDPKHLKKYVIGPTLKSIGLYSEAAVNLLLGTAAVESEMGFYLHQIEGPALGIYQMEPATHDCIWDNFLKYRPILTAKVSSYHNSHLKHEDLIGNLYYATAMARLKYFRSPRELPKADDIEGLAKMWRFDYNSILGAHTNEAAILKFKKAYRKYVHTYI